MKQFQRNSKKHNSHVYKGITTMVIRPLDDRTQYAQSVVADLQPVGLGYVWGLGGAHLVARPYIPITSLLTHEGLSLTVWLQFQRGTFRQPSLGLWRR